MPSIGTTSRPAYIYDVETDTWIPVGQGPHTHASTDIAGLQSVLDQAISPFLLMGA